MIGKEEIKVEGTEQRRAPVGRDRKKGGNSVWRLVGKREGGMGEGEKANERNLKGEGKRKCRKGGWG